MSMSLLQSTMSAESSARTSETTTLGYRIRVGGAAAAILLLALIAFYGANYYVLPLDQRPYSEKHELLKPGGAIGLKLGIIGTALFFVIFLYVLRKVIPFLGRWGTARQWMDFHILAGVFAPIIIAFHASFKFQGIAGVAFWIMVAVALSGVMGRYLYAQIPRSLNAAELSLSEMQFKERELAEALAGQCLYSTELLNRSLRVPTKEHVRGIGGLRALWEMLVLDMELPLRAAALRRSACGMGEMVLSLGGILPTGDDEVEHIVRLVRGKVWLSKRVVFLDQTHKVFHLWHVIHRPFSDAFVTLAIIHIAVVLGLGFGSLGLH